MRMPETIANQFTLLLQVPGDDVIVHPAVKGEEAEKMFPKMQVVKPYLRFTPLPRDQTSANV